MIIDGHLDLAYNARLGRDLTLPLAGVRAQSPEAADATVSFAVLRQGGVALCLGTLFALPQQPERPSGYTDPAGARQQALDQLEVYRRWQGDGHIRLLNRGAEVTNHLAEYARNPEVAPLGVVLLMEGADPICDAADLPFWADQGVRIVGPAWKRTRYAGGTGEPGGLTPAGEELLHAMRDLGVALDASHLAEEAFWQAIELQPKVIASHSNARALVPGDRQLSDDMARAIGARGGVVGLVLYNGFVQAGWGRGDLPVPIESVVGMCAHLAGLVGWDHLGLGSDLDGGFGAAGCPDGIDSAADLPRLAAAIPVERRAGVLGGNWARWLAEQL